MSKQEPQTFAEALAALAEQVAKLRDLLYKEFPPFKLIAWLLRLYDRLTGR